MVGLKQMLKNKMDDDRSFATCVSKIAGYANPTGFYKFLNKDECEFKDIQKLIEIVQYAFPEREYDIMDQYIRTLNPNNALARQALEYANVNKLDSLFEFLLDELSACSNADSKEWAAVYKIDWDAACGRIEPLEGIDLLNELTLKTQEMKVYSRLVKFYIYYELRLVDIMSKKQIMIEHDLKKLKESYIKNMYECRSCLIMADIYLHNNQLQHLRNSIEDCIKKINNHNLLSSLYTQLGNSYIMESYEKSIMFLNKALEISRNTNNAFRFNETCKSINFLNSYHKKKIDFINVNNDENSILADKGYYSYMNNTSDGLSLLNLVNISEFSDSGKGFYYFYLGQATQNKDYYYESIKYFNLSGEKFYKKLSIIELEKMGENRVLLSTLSV